VEAEDCLLYDFGQHARVQSLKGVQLVRASTEPLFELLSPQLRLHALLVIQRNGD
jgi:hypothetical protein